MTGKIEQDREPTTIEQWRDRTLMATDPVEATYWLTHVADAFAVHWGASEPLSTCNEWGQAFRYVVKLYVDAEIEALTRRNAELADALDDVLDYQHHLPEWLVDKVHVALTPTESEATRRPASRCECARGTHDVLNSDCPMNWRTESEAK